MVKREVMHGRIIIGQNQKFECAGSLCSDLKPSPAKLFYKFIKKVKIDLELPN